MDHIDLDRGVEQRKHPNGSWVFLYVGILGVGAELGAYYNVHGVQVPHGFAKEAGFDVDSHLLVREEEDLRRQVEVEVQAEMEKKRDALMEKRITLAAHEREKTRQAALEPEPGPLRPVVKGR